MRITALMARIGVCAAAISTSGALAQCEDLSPGLILGPASNSGATDQVLATATVVRAGASAIRLFFADGDVLPGGSYLRITSVQDGLSQNIDNREIAEWGWSSAIFNGDSVLLELVCAPGTNGNTISVIRVCRAGMLGMTDGCEPCAAVPPASNEAWAARMVTASMDYYCSAAMWSTRSCLVSAGHCAHPPGSIAEFNVPPSTAGGSAVHPAPSDQYVVTSRLEGTHVFHDWSVLTLAKSGGLTAFQRQGVLRRIGTGVVPVPGDAIRTAGYGITPSGTGNQSLAQKVTLGNVVTTANSGFYYNGYSHRGNSGGGVTTTPYVTGAVETIGGVFSSFCAGPTCSGSNGLWTLAWGVNDAGFAAARQSLCGDCLRDCNGDGLITQLDRGVLLAWIGVNNPMGDLTGDGFVNEADLLFFDQLEIGSACVQAAP